MPVVVQYLPVTHLPSYTEMEHPLFESSKRRERMNCPAQIRFLQNAWSIAISLILSDLSLTVITALLSVPWSLSKQRTVFDLDVHSDTSRRADIRRFLLCNHPRICSSSVINGYGMTTPRTPDLIYINHKVSFSLIPLHWST
jgi:hypothetical protein